MYWDLYVGSSLDTSQTKHPSCWNQHLIQSWWHLIPELRNQHLAQALQKSQEYHIEIYKRFQSQSMFSLKIETWTIFQHTINYTIVLSPPDPNKFGLFGSRKLAYPQQFFTSYYTIQLCYSISQAKQSTVQLFPSSPWNLYVSSISILITLRQSKGGNDIQRKQQSKKRWNLHHRNVLNLSASSSHSDKSKGGNYNIQRKQQSKKHWEPQIQNILNGSTTTYHYVYGFPSLHLKRFLLPVCEETNQLLLQDLQN